MDAQSQDQLMQPSPLFRLPTEIIQHVLSYLKAQHLVSLRRTCKELCEQASRDQLWLNFIAPNVPSYDLPQHCGPASSFRQLYLSHHPYWHLPRYKIWFSDDAYNGKLILVKYDWRRGKLDGYRLIAERPTPVSETWSFKPSVIIHHVNPQVRISNDDPVLSLPFPYTSDLVSRINTRSQRETWNLSTELRMRVGRPEQRINAALMLSKDLPSETANTPNVQVWPPRTIPDMPRTRSSTAGNSSDSFKGSGHKPHSIEEISQTTFRLRTWSHFTQGMLSLGVRIGEEVSTWSTLDPKLYTPTPQKPYQGIFVGDYAAHGCEFLLILQTDQAPQPGRRRTSNIGANNGDDENASSGARHRNYISAVLAALREQQFRDEEDMNSMTDPKTYQKSYPNVPGQPGYVQPNVPDPDGVIHRGALEGIKLTGDVNVPRGEHTFIADDIGADGLVRIAGESPFRGARVVRSRGHVAARGFRNEEFIPSQLFLINPNLLAQYWLPFGHISFYKRINIDEMLQNVSNDRRARRRQRNGETDLWPG